MRHWFVMLAVAIAAACSPETPAPDAAAPVETAEETPAADYGPYANAWDSDAVSRFGHTLFARTPGEHEIVLTAQTNSPGGETVAIYPMGPDGEPLSTRIVFVIATTGGNSATGVLAFPEDGSGVPVMVAVENASGRRLAGSYTITVTPD